MNDEEKVIAALENLEWDWRSIDGICKETGLSSEVINKILLKIDDKIVRTYDRNGNPIYTTRNHYKVSQSFLKRTISAATGSFQP